MQSDGTGMRSSWNQRGIPEVWGEDAAGQRRQMTLRFRAASSPTQLGGEIYAIWQEGELWLAR
jgi:hypothetical protein